MAFLQSRKASEQIASSRGFFTVSVFFVALAMAAPAGPGNADELQDYAAACDKAIGVTVPDFDCDAGTDVPGQGTVFSGNHPGATCDEPNRLRGLCDPGSRFQVLNNDENAIIVAHCRKEDGDPHMYGDIAVIQYSPKNGATCFYQALGNENHGDMLGGKPDPESSEMPVKAPSNGQRPNTLWMDPKSVADIGCGGCHDNGPLIRSPYLNGVPGKDMLPGSDDDTFNSKGDPYSFVGDAFKDWVAYTVEVSGDASECTSCHRLGVSNIPVPQRAHNEEGKDKGTAMDFATRATAAQEDSKNPPSAASPIWMERNPVETVFDKVAKAHSDWAAAIHECAEKFDPSNLPDRDDCRIKPFAQAYVPSP
jgi:hypothetical protein